MACALALVGVAAAVGALVKALGVNLLLGAPPIFGYTLVHAGPGTPFALALAGAGVVWSGRAVARLPWRALLAVGWLTGLAWTISLALIDGWRRGWVQRLEDPNEYLYELPRIDDIGLFLRTFTTHILDFEPGRWTTHVAAHPPLATLFFEALDRAGLRGGGWAGLAVVLVGSLVTVAVPVTLRALGAGRAARAGVPFVAFFPGAVWMGVSADGMFAGVAAAGVALSASGVVGRRTWSPLLALAGGLLLGAALYLSYGLVLMGFVVGAVALVTLTGREYAAGLGGDPAESGRGRASWPRRGLVSEPGRSSVRRRGRRVDRWPARCALVVFGLAAVVATFEVIGFSWFEGLQLLRIRYYQGIASERPYAYFVWANLAALVLCAGPMVAPALARATGTLVRLGRGSSGAESAWRRVTATGGGPAWHRITDRTAADAVVPSVLSVSALVAIVLADLSGLSKAETERIWLPFAVWLLPALTLLAPERWRFALSVQVATALLVNHLLVTHW
jgi:hypothetical protein